MHWRRFWFIFFYFQVIFERFSAPSLMLANQSCLALYSKGLVTGLCLNSGFYFTQSTPIYEGHALPYATTQLDIGGDTITNYLNRNIMSTQGHQFNTSSEKLLLNSMKQDLCYVALGKLSFRKGFRKVVSMLLACCHFSFLTKNTKIKFKSKYSSMIRQKQLYIFLFPYL